MCTVRAMDLATPYDRLRDWIDRIAALGDEPDDDADLRVRKHALAITVLGLIPAAVMWSLIGLLIDRPLLTAGSVYFAVALPLTLVLLGRTKAFMPIVRILLVTGLAYVVLGHLALGGMATGGASLIWGLVAPVSAILYFDHSSSLRWFGVFVVIVVLAVVLDPWISTMLPASWSKAPTWLFAYNLLGPSLIVLLLVRYVDGQRLTAQLESRELLHQMLPGSIAERLADGERLIAESHESVSVLFADVVGFTQIAGNLAASELIVMLNQLFSIFDRISARHGLEKIKTSGDAYIAVAGAPSPMERHADAAVLAALEMQRAVALLGGFRRRALQVRIGIASGPVTAGVIGEHRYAYDLWGDTVNLASRMESVGIAGQIQVSATTRGLMRRPMPWVERQVDVKGKGLMTTYLLDPGAVPDAVTSRPVEVAALAERFQTSASTPKTESAGSAAAAASAPSAAPAEPMVGRSESSRAIL
jgi:adenylate cyclase